MVNVVLQDFNYTVNKYMNVFAQNETYKASLLVYAFLYCYKASIVGRQTEILTTSYTSNQHLITEERKEKFIFIDRVGSAIYPTPQRAIKLGSKKTSSK